MRTRNRPRPKCPTLRPATPSPDSTRSARRASGSVSSASSRSRSRPTSTAAPSTKPFKRGCARAGSGSMASTFVGIDLGTTNSVVAYRNAYGRPEVIANREGQNITPSVVYFGSDPPAVGQEAKEWARLGNEEIASFFKPHMGSPLFQLQFHGRNYNATDLSALVLKRLKEDAEA